VFWAAYEKFFQRYAANALKKKKETIL